MKHLCLCRFLPAVLCLSLILSLTACGGKDDAPETGGGNIDVESFSGGKGGASDASAEVVGKVRRLMNDNGVFWQMAEMGKTDAGGGGTVAKFMAQRNIDTLDAGVPVLSMHAPYETVAKLDCYMTYKCMKAIFEQA